MPDDRSTSRPTVMAVWLIIAGAVGWWAAFQLTLEKLHVLANPETNASCDFSVLVQCTANLTSPQGSVFGFPNPIIGLTAWMAPVVVGFALLAGARFARWFWWLFELGLTLALVFVVWLIAQSIFALGTLCPWCMATWAVTIPTFYVVTLHLLRSGILPASASVRRGAASLMKWVPLITFVSYAVIAAIAQIRLDALTNIFGGLFG
ncbi:MAG: vitamin K epoxide reductase family protein [Microbacterium sp.]|uniref:vitamin K epoxide reductase family protein n=1 Tax=Microbacterium sp. TaxID=51671 RepID=UPI0039E3FA2E